MTPSEDFEQLVREEVAAADARYPGYHSAHEAFAVLLEEVDELWDEVRKKQALRDRDQMVRELVQVAAVCHRFAAYLKSGGRG
jgi:NTP pyrophosphatase (non-canonical NTP hydrolase)